MKSKIQKALCVPYMKGNKQTICVLYGAVSPSKLNQGVLHWVRIMYDVNQPHRVLRHTNVY